MVYRNWFQQGSTKLKPRARQQHEEIEALRAKLIRAEQSGFSDRTPEQIREAAKSRLKKDV